MIKNLITLFFLLAAAVSVYSQQDPIVSILKDIEAGNLENARTKFDQIKSKNTNEAGVIFVEGLLTQNASEAVKFFISVYKNFPKSNYADAAVFRIYSYYTAVGDKASSEKYLKVLKTEYPKSSYLAGITKQQSPALTQNKEESKPSEQTKPVVKESYYSLQAGAFSVLRNSLLLKDKLARAGWMVEIREKSVGGANFFIVYAGAYGSENEAKSAKDKLLKEQNLDGRIVTLDK